MPRTAHFFCMYVGECVYLYMDCSVCVHVCVLTVLTVNVWVQSNTLSSTVCFCPCVLSPSLEVFVYMSACMCVCVSLWCYLTRLHTSPHLPQSMCFLYWFNPPDLGSASVLVYVRRDPSWAPGARFPVSFALRVHLSFRPELIHQRLRAQTGEPMWGKSLNFFPPLWCLKNSQGEQESWSAMSDYFPFFFFHHEKIYQ